MYNTNNSRKEYEWIYLQTMIRSENYILRNRLAENFSIWHQKGVDSTYNLPNDLFLVKQLYMGTYVFEICKILEISSWFVNEIMIFEIIYRNRTKRHVWAKSTKTI
jgi:hypothetical protein